MTHLKRGSLFVLEKFIEDIYYEKVKGTKETAILKNSSKTLPTYDMGKSEEIMEREIMFKQRWTIRWALLTIVGCPVVNCSTQQKNGNNETTTLSESTSPSNENQPQQSTPKEEFDQQLWNIDEKDQKSLRKLESALRNTKSHSGQLDYALFLYAFKPAKKERDAKIKEITENLVNLAKKEAYPGAIEDFFKNGKTSFDGTDKSMISILRFVSVTGVARTHMYFYAIPMPILKKNPKLLKATEPYWGSARDNSLPQAGLEYGRGVIKNFPQKEVDAYFKILWRVQIQKEFDALGTIRYALGCVVDSCQTSLILEPNLKPVKLTSFQQGFLSNPDLKKALTVAANALAQYYRKEFHLTEEKSKQAAMNGLLKLNTLTPFITEEREHP